MKSIFVLLVTGAGLVTASAAGAQDFTSTVTDCSGLELFWAAGLPDGVVHKYQFRGVCRELEKSEGKVLGVRWQGWVEVDSRYDVKTAQFDEGVKVDMTAGSGGPLSGTIQIRLKCAQDPMLTAPSCAVMEVDQGTTWPDFVGAWTKNAPYTKGKVNYAQAVELSKLAASNTPPPPPPPVGEQKPLSGQVLPADQAPVTTMKRPPQPAAPTARPTPDRQLPLKAIPVVPVLPPGATAIQLVPDAKVALQSGYALAARPVEGSLRWIILGKAGEIMRTFPARSHAYRSAQGDVLVNWGGGTFNAGPAEPQRLIVPR